MSEPTIEVRWHFENGKKIIDEWKEVSSEMIQSSVNKELWNAFMLAWEAAPDGEVVLQARFALEAVAPMLIAQGFEEALELAEQYEDGIDDYKDAMLKLLGDLRARAQELDPK